MCFLVNIKVKSIYIISYNKPNFSFIQTVTSIRNEINKIILNLQEKITQKDYSFIISYQLAIFLL